MVSCVVTVCGESLCGVQPLGCHVCPSVCLSVGILEDHVVHIVERDPLPVEAESSSEDSRHTDRHADVCACCIAETIVNGVILCVVQLLRGTPLQPRPLPRLKVRLRSILYLAVVRE